MTDTLTAPEVQPPSAPPPEPPRRSGRSSYFVVAVGLVLAAGALVAILLTAGGGSSKPAAKAAAPAASKPAATKPAAPALGHAVNVSLSEFKVAPNVQAAKAGKVTFSVSNKGNITHEFVVIRTDKPAGSLLKGARADETGNVGETGDLAAGASKSITLNLKAGHYALICNLPGHYRSGQHTDFTIR